MKNYIKIILTAMLMIVVATVSVSAAETATLTYDLVEVDASASKYEISVSLASETVENVLTVASYFTFDNTKITITDAYDHSTMSDEDLALHPDYPITTIASGNRGAAYSLIGPTWTPDGTKTQSYITVYTTDGTPFDLTGSGVKLYTISVIFANGITPESLTTSDFAVDYVYIKDKTGNVYGYNEPTANKNAVVVNNIAQKTGHIPSASTIAVPAASTIYFVDGTSATYAEATDVEIPAVAGIVYVNTGYTGQTVYSINSDGIPTKIDKLDNAVLGFGGAGIRTEEVQGIRFRSSVSNSLKHLTTQNDGYELKEYGFVVVAETTKTGLLDTDYTLDLNLVAAGIAKRGVAYNKIDGINFVFANDGEQTHFTNVVKNIPAGKTAYNSIIASRPYCILFNGTNEIVLYGEVTKRSVYSVAAAIKNANGDDYANNKEYIDEVIRIAS